MILGFSVSNFKSFYNNNSFSLLSSSKIRKHKEHLYIEKKFKVLKYAFFLGPNAGGKTNLIRAIDFYRYFIISNRIPYIDYTFKDKVNEETSFSLSFLINKTIYTYSYSIQKGKSILDGTNLTKEKLVKSSLYGEETLIYELKDNVVTFNKKIELNNNLKVYLSNYNSSKKQFTFLGYLNDSSRKDNLGNNVNDINEVFNYISQKILIINNSNINLNHLENVDLNELSTKLKKYDTGIDHINFVNLNEEEIAKKIPSKILEEIKNDSLKTNFHNAILQNEQELFYFNKENGDIKIKELLFKHNNISSNFTYNEESEGTLHILCLLSFLSSKNKDTTILIDELDLGLHPLLTIELIKDFMKTNIDTNQLICSSHLTLLLRENILRSDEIYFVDKNNLGMSTIYSLSEYKTRSDTNLEKDYLNGRYAAIPTFVNAINTHKEK